MFLIHDFIDPKLEDNRKVFGKGGNGNGGKSGGNFGKNGGQNGGKSGDFGYFGGGKKVGIC